MEEIKDLAVVVEHIARTVNPPIGADGEPTQRFEYDGFGKLYDTWHRDPEDETGTIQKERVYDFMTMRISGMSGEFEPSKVATSHAKSAMLDLNRQVAQAKQRLL